MGSIVYVIGSSLSILVGLWIWGRVLARGMGNWEAYSRARRMKKTRDSAAERDARAVP